MIGQMSIFDFPQWLPGSDDFETMTNERAAELVGNHFGVKFKFVDGSVPCYAAKIDGVEVQIHFSRYHDNIGSRSLKRFISSDCWYKDSGTSCPCESIEECISRIEGFLKTSGKSKEGICKHSGHKCNKESLWEVASSFDEFECYQSCCRQCPVRFCGARCNGSVEPTHQKKPVEISGICDDGYCPDCDVWLDDLIPKCPQCGCALDWTRWKVMNEA